MSVILGLVVGLLTVRLLVMRAAGCSTPPVLQRPNYRGRRVPTAAGIFVVLAVARRRGRPGAARRVRPRRRARLDIARLLVLFACVGFGLLGLVDDLLGTRRPRVPRPPPGARRGPGHDRRC